ncbi:MAG: aminomethyltransferase beta-barrel domain-containing protein [Bryobacterales bacterium]
MPAGERTGEVVDASGQPLAEYGGIHRFTIGQRKGWAWRPDSRSTSAEILPAERRVVVGPREALERRVFEVERLNWISMAALEAPVEVEVKIRYQFRPVAATVSPSETPGQARVEMHAPQLAVTPGQAAVFYRGEEGRGRRAGSAAEPFDDKVEQHRCVQPQQHLHRPARRIAANAALLGPPSLNNQLHRLGRLKQCRLERRRRQPHPTNGKTAGRRPSRRLGRRAARAVCPTPAVARRSLDR